MPKFHVKELVGTFVPLLMIKNGYCCWLLLPGANQCFFPNKRTYKYFIQKFGLDGCKYHSKEIAYIMVTISSYLTFNIRTPRYDSKSSGQKGKTPLVPSY